jgi:hypothetical protein
MMNLNILCLKILQFFKTRSILFYIFWLCLFIGEGFYQMLVKLKGCTPWLNQNKLIGYSLNHYQNVACDPIENGFIEACMLVCLLTVVAYFFWYVFKCLRFIYRLGFKR